ncbi:MULTISPECIES: acyl-CoA synthetase MbcS [Bacillus]|uniref:acyl-CoA synthetase MbcS n=1 Tax=Bacillus TaxID=1386 RepID=UPI001B33B879|nr:MULTISPECIES: acyl--CoA ligase [Bacillus]MCY7497021.1 acyl--CoA ligase [Bacillus altitudinis]MCY7534404.1 acyl--CoA ligase [Bacillus altitudinis]MCY7546918.1 acyl--CoA ligase [Bacillus altitudinis]MCY7554870.1 acyl--CoA ligase [Bacillus altitudinis]MCY7590901.1 acyl--CoA ligase [Bacillus altitudinis]
MKREDLIAPEQYNLVSEIEAFSHDQKKIALHWQDGNGHEAHVTYAALVEEANKIGHVLLNAGFKKGDKIIVMVPRMLEAYSIYLAILKTGMVVIPCSEMLRAKDIDYRIEHAEAKGAIVYASFIQSFEGTNQPKDFKTFSIGENDHGWTNIVAQKEEQSSELKLADTTRTDMAFLSYTSGTTGNPKGVVHTHGWAYAHLRTAAKAWLSINEGDKVWATAGPGWQKWVWSPLLSVLGSGAEGFVYGGKFNPDTYLELLQKNEINVLCCTPTEYRFMAKVDDLSQYELPTLHSAVSAGEPLNREVIDTFKKHFDIEVRDGYGQTESTLLVGVLKGMDIKPGSMGKPTPGNEVEIIDENGQICAPGEIGDIAVHLETPALFKEYYKDAERTKAQRRGDYFITGDRAKKDEDGYFWFESRRDDIIVSSGYTIGPFEVEDALIKHPAVKECAVVASPDEIRGSIVKAYVVLRDASAQSDELIKELQTHVKNTTAPYKYPREIEFIDELPKTPSAKIRRVELRERELARKG